MGRPFLSSVEKINGFLNGDVKKLEDPVIRTGIPLFENAAEGGFHARQVIRLSRGKKYKPDLSPLRSASFLITYELGKSLRRSRAH